MRPAHLRSTPVGFQSYLTAIRDDNSFTPDLPHLVKNFRRVPLFVYGTEKLAFSEEDVLHGCDRIGLAFSVSDIFHLYVTKENEPVMIPDPAASTSGRVKGELFSIPIEKLVQLDERYNNGLLFNRRQYMFVWYSPVGANKGRRFMSNAYVYLGVPTYWKAKRENSGQDFWRIGEMFSNGEGKSYYSFTDAYDKPNRRLRCL